VRLSQDFDQQHMVGRFRLALASLERPAGLGLSDELLTQLVAPSPSEETKQRLLAAFQRGDERRVALDTELAAARMPLTIDQRVVDARAALELAQRPVPPDPLLARLERDFEQSRGQLENLRLTMAQDLAWAMVNSPAFLFNR
jgi:hypothetical protein